MYGQCYLLRIITETLYVFRRVLPVLFFTHTFGSGMLAACFALKIAERWWKQRTALKEKWLSASDGYSYLSQIAVLFYLEAHLRA